jgi:hypothetical protein
MAQPHDKPQTDNATTIAHKAAVLAELRFSEGSAVRDCVDMRSGHRIKTITPRDCFTTDAEPIVVAGSRTES